MEGEGEGEGEELKDKTDMAMEEISFISKQREREYNGMVTRSDQIRSDQIRSDQCSAEQSKVE